MAAPTIECRKLSFRYPGQAHAIKEVNFSVARGEIVAILGENGAGKTTLLKHFNGILTPSGGKVLIQGREITKKNMKDVRRKVGFIFQNPDDQLFSATVAQDVAFGPANLGLGKEEILERVEAALAVVGMEGFGKRSPHTLSTGEKRRVCFAGVLAMKPEILVLDEPTANLDPKGAAEILELVKSLNTKRGLSVVLSTHNVNIVPHIAKRACVLSGGHVVLDGSTREVFGRGDILKKANLELPDVAKLAHMLKKDGHNLTGLPLTAEEARLAIGKLLDGKR